MLEKFYFYSFLLFLLSFPLSVSISQSFAVLSILFYASLLIKQKNIPKLPLPFYILLFYFLSYIPSLIYHFQEYPDEAWKLLKTSELSDIWMCFILPVAYKLFQDKQKRKLILYIFFFSFFLLFLSGFISLFTPFRLAYYIRDGFKVLPGVRLQHLAGRTFGIVTYLPLGLMNTHLTYGGLLSLFLPGIGFYSLHSIYKNFRQSKFSYIFFLLLLLVPALFVFFYNQSRSAWLGLVFSVCFTLISIRTLRIFLFKPIVLFSFISLLVLGIFSASILIEKNWMLKRAFQQLNKKNSTENQRYFIYRFSLKIVQNSPLLGAGPGRFRIEHEMASQEMVKKQEQLWYESSITPRGHAHHDILHSQASGGILASFLLFLFWYQLFSGLIYSRFNSYLLLFSGILSLYVAGFFQCYFQDDEVLLPFLTFTGFYLASIKSRKTHFSFPLLLILFLLLFSSVGLILYRNIPSPSEVYERKIFTGTQEEKEAYGKSLKGLTAKLPSSKAKSGFRLEGCLNQRFGNPILPRKEDYSIALTIPKNAANPPQSVRVQAWERDAFDQDKEYKAHELRHLKDYYFELHTGRNILTFPGLLSAEGSVAFPENVYFRDFTFLFQVNESEPIFSIPQIDPGELCNAK